MLRWTAAAAAVGFLLASGVAQAQVSDTDNTAAWLDAGVGSGVAQTSRGTGTDFGGMVGATDAGVQVEIEVDSDIARRVRFRSLNTQNCMASVSNTDVGVIYVDSVTGGFADTSTFTDIGSADRAAISAGRQSSVVAVGAPNLAPLSFPSGFRPDYAIAFRNTNPLEDGAPTPTARLYELSTGTHTPVADLDMFQTSSSSCAEWEMALSLGDIGLESGETFRWIATVINADNGYRSNEFQGFAHSGTPPTIGTTSFTVPDFNSFQSVGRVLINEVDAEQPGTDDGEFIELRGPPGVELQGTLIAWFVPRAFPVCPQGIVELAGESLDGATGYFVAGDSAVSPDVGLPGVGDDHLPAGPAGIGLYVFDTFPGKCDIGGFDDWRADGVVYGGADSNLESELLRPSTSWVTEPEQDHAPLEDVSRQRCPGNDDWGSWSLTGDSRTNPATPGGGNDCSVCGDGSVTPGFEQCDPSPAISIGGGVVRRDCCAADCSFEDAGLLCRGEADLCDAAEVCTGSDAACPADGVLPMGEPCRAAADVCDVEEVCNGTSVTCPVDAFESPSTVCRASGGACDSAETCTGSSADCPPNRLEPMGTVCRPGLTLCDAEEVCSGSDLDCPPDLAVMMGTVCRPEAGDCDVAEVCDGTSTTCPADALLDSTTVCRMSTGACDAEELCTGAGPMCPADMASMDGTSCDDGTVCNGDETCMGGSCMSGTAPDCDDSNLCTTDMCAEPGGCASVDVPGCCNVDGDCDDGDVCTADSCSGPGGVCSASPITGCCEVDADCDDGNSCTTNTCDTAANRCASTPVPGCCMADTDCDDANACTTDTCDASTGSCTNAEVADCCASDGDCDDDNTCTMDACDLSTGTCTNDMLAGCCLTDADCDDDDECTTDSCDTATATCSTDRIPGCGVDAGAGDADSGVGGDAGDVGGDDGGSRDAGTGTGGGDGAVADAGMEMTDGGCACRATAPRGPSSAWLLALGALAFWRRRRRVSR